MVVALWELGADVVRIIAEYWAETEEECLALEAVSDAHTARVIDGFPWTVSKFRRWVDKCSSSNDMFEKHRAGLLRLASVTSLHTWPTSIGSRQVHIWPTSSGSRQVHIYPSIRNGKVLYSTYTDWQSSTGAHSGPIALLWAMQQLKLL